MFRYWLAHRAPVSALLSIVMIAVLLFGFVSPYINAEAENRSKLGVYENSDVDFDIPQPTKEQLDEIAALPFVDAVFGYYYTESSVDVNGKSVLTKILFSEHTDVLEHTMYSPARLIEESAESYSNPVYIDFAYAQKNNIKLGDTIKLSSITFQVARIYETNSYYTSAIFMPLIGEQKELIEGKSTSFSGAFLIVNDTSKAEEYMRTYKPMGRLKDRSLFETEAEYQLHYEQWEKTSYANEITAFAAKQGEGASKSAVSMWVGAAVVLAVMAFFNILMFNSKNEKGYFRAKKTKTGNAKFFTWTAVEELVLMAASAVAGGMMILKSVEFYCPQTLIMEAVVVLGVTIIGTVLICYLLNCAMLSSIKDAGKKQN